MKNSNSFTLILVFIAFLLTNCGQIAKEVAKDNLDGRYNGKATYIYHYSQLNLGIEDGSKSEDCFAMVFSIAKAPSIVLLPCLTKLH